MLGDAVWTKTEKFAIAIGAAIGAAVTIYFTMRTFSVPGMEKAPTALTILPILTAVLAAIFGSYSFIRSTAVELGLRAATEKKIEQIEVKVSQEPEKTRFAWDLARVKLEAYFDRNLSQVKMIFVVAVLVMFVGFVFVLWGVLIAITNPQSTRTSYVAAISGIITQFIGATFMLIYRSTMAQANQFMEILERINTVGMAVQILDSIPETESNLKNSTRAEIVGLLLASKAKTT